MLQYHREQREARRKATAKAGRNLRAVDSVGFRLVTRNAYDWAKGRVGVTLSSGCVRQRHLCL